MKPEVEIRTPSSQQADPEAAYTVSVFAPLASILKVPLNSKKQREIVELDIRHIVCVCVCVCVRVRVCVCVCVCV